MTIATILSDTAFVCVILLMAGVARGRSLPIFLFWFVTGFAVRFLGIYMSAAEEKVRLGVIEGLFIDRGDIFGPPPVFGMALFAFLLRF